MTCLFLIFLVVFGGGRGYRLRMRSCIALGGLLVMTAAACNDDAPANGSPDLAKDSAMADVARTDAPTLDTAPLDTPPLDAPPLDAALPDTSTPDMAAPDTALPDAVTPDTAAPDTSSPDQMLPPDAAPAGAAYHVSTSGKDSNPGTLAHPFATLTRARDAVRAHKKAKGLPPTGITVWIRGGLYQLTKAVTLDSQDSGAPGAPVTYGNYNNEKVHIVGGQAVSGFAAVTSPAALARIDKAYHAKILQADLKAQGITSYGQMKSRGFGRSMHQAGLELFLSGQPMPLARWPNSGWAAIASTPAGKNGGKFGYSGDRPKRWTQATDVWVHGYWTYDWADSYELVTAIDTAKRVISTQAPHGIYGYTQGQRWQALNLLEELDQPGEWYLDRKAGVLYWWPPGPIPKGQPFVSLASTLFNVSGASHVTLAGLVLEYTRGNAVIITGGEQVLVAGCTIRCTGNRAVSIKDGKGHGVLSSDISHTGDGGVVLSGGDRKTLAPAGHFVINTHFQQFSRWSRTYRPAVQLGGVGHKIRHNRMHHGSHNAIQLSGNDHLVELNEIHDVCTETGDVGAIYMGRDWTMRGTVIRHNYFHHIPKKHTGATVGVYLDDCASGQQVYGNVFSKLDGRAVLLGGGRDNQVDNNVFVDTAMGMQVDARALGWAKNSAAPGGSWKMYDKLKAVAHDKPPYSTKYPALATILTNSPPTPLGNTVRRNVFYKTAKPVYLVSGMKSAWLIQKDNWTSGDPGFTDAAKGDFSLKASSPVWKLGFKSIPLSKIGLFKDQYRTSLP